MLYPNFRVAYEKLSQQMEHNSLSIHTDNWQSSNISGNPNAAMQELVNQYLQIPMTGENLELHQKDISPNLPWADRHFELERVSGQPINPGETWKEWPYASSADKFRRAGEKFSHSYAERYWPKHAEIANLEGTSFVQTGIRYPYGDLNDVVQLLARDPYTRQAYLPVWFPEDTGTVHGERVPCTLGYHFMRRRDYLHIFYPIRSCDFVRHLRDDWYLTVRLLLWVLNRLRAIDRDNWDHIAPGMFSMWIGSLHCFIGDWQKLYGKASR